MISLKEILLKQVKRYIVHVAQDTKASTKYREEQSTTHNYPK